MYIYGSTSLIILRMRNILDEGCRENQNSHFIFSIPPPKTSVIHEKMWENMVEPDYDTI